MKPAIRPAAVALVTAVLATVLATPVLADQKRKDAEDQVEFGMALAKSGLWSVAVTHWQKAVQIDESYPAAWNNLAIGFEQTGKFAEAREAYETALKLDPKNNYIRHNYQEFREIYDRQNRRRSGG
jgi:Flp pilus assembly protein TadD